MHTILNILLYIALAATAITLVFGLITMSSENKPGREERSNKLMRYRILFQAAALILLALLLFTSRT
jgi:hypothetical protein